MLYVEHVLIQAYPYCINFYIPEYIVYVYSIYSTICEQHKFPA